MRPPDSHEHTSRQIARRNLWRYLSTMARALSKQHLSNEAGPVGRREHRHFFDFMSKPPIEATKR
jgi:hypothetical protein